MMHIKNNRLTCCHPSTAAFAILLTLGFLALSAPASSSWIEVHPPIFDEIAGIELIHFIDTDNGWAESKSYRLDADGRMIGLGPDVLLRTFDGGRSWGRAEPHDILHIYPGGRYRRTHFVSPAIGWKLGDDPPKDPEPLLAGDIEIYHTGDGGMTWQPRHGKVEELVWHGNADPIPPIGGARRLASTHIHFIDEQYGWLVGFTGIWLEPLPDEKRRPLEANFFCSTSDAAHSWKCHVHPYPWNGLKGDEPGLRRPYDVDFVDRQTGWVSPGEEWMHRTGDGGLTWGWTSHPLPAGGNPFIDKIDFVDESLGWAIGVGLWITEDGGKTWTENLRGFFNAIFADTNGCGSRVGVGVRMRRKQKKGSSIRRTMGRVGGWNGEAGVPLPISVIMKSPKPYGRADWMARFLNAPCQPLPSPRLANSPSSGENSKPLATPNNAPDTVLVGEGILPRIGKRLYCPSLPQLPNANLFRHRQSHYPSDPHPHPRPAPRIPLIRHQRLL